MLFRSVSQSRYTGTNKVIGGGLEKLINKLDFTFGGMTPIKDAMKALIKAASKGLKEVITKSGKKDKDGNWTEDTIRELFKD